MLGSPVKPTVPTAQIWYCLISRCPFPSGPWVLPVEQSHNRIMSSSILVCPKRLIWRFGPTSQKAQSLCILNSTRSRVDFAYQELLESIVTNHAYECIISGRMASPRYRLGYFGVSLVNGSSAILG